MEATAPTSKQGTPLEIIISCTPEEWAAYSQRTDAVSVARQTDRSFLLNVAFIDAEQQIRLTYEDTTIWRIDEYVVDLHLTVDGKVMAVPPADVIRGRLIASPSLSSYTINGPAPEILTEEW